MASSYFVAIFVCFQVAHSQYYNVPASSYPSYSYYYPPSKPTAPSLEPTFPNIQPSTPDKASKRSVSTPPTSCVKCSPQTASAYFLSTPSKKVKATFLPKEKANPTVLPKKKAMETSILAPTYSCPLCNNFADVPPNLKIPPPPPIGSPALPELLDKFPTVDILKELTTKFDDLKESPIMTPKKPLFSDMYEKHKVPKNLSFDQELLEGFLTGLGIAL